MVLSETTTCIWCMVWTITNSLNKQDGYRGETRYALMERDCVLFYLIIILREGSQARCQLLTTQWNLISFSEQCRLYLPDSLLMTCKERCNMHESWIVYRELAKPVFWKLSKGFQGNTLGHFCIREPEILLKKASTNNVSSLGKYLKMGDFWQLDTFTFDV